MSDDAPGTEAQRLTEEDLQRLEKLCAENTPDADVTFDPESAECTRCGTSMCLNEMAEWEDDPRGNVCNDCAAVFYTYFYDQVPRLLAEIRASRQQADAPAPLLAETMASVAVLDAEAVAGKDYDHSIHDSPDAMRWAQLFVETTDKLGQPHPDLDTMLGWFANAMMAMHDHMKRAASRGTGEKE